jgi:hypothetical protein
MSEVTKETSLAYHKRRNLSEAFMKNTKLTFTLHIGGKQVDHLTDEQLEKMAQRLSETMSSYYTAHPKEYQQLK